MQKGIPRMVPRGRGSAGLGTGTRDSAPGTLELGASLKDTAAALSWDLVSCWHPAGTARVRE